MRAQYRSFMSARADAVLSFPLYDASVSGDIVFFGFLDFAFQPLAFTLASNGFDGG